MRHTFAIAQATIAKRVTDNAKKMEAMMRGMQERSRAELIPSPETCMVEFLREMTWELRAGTVETLDGSSVSAMRELVVRSSIWTVFGFYERAETVDSESHSYSNALILDGRGEIYGHYRKTYFYGTFGYRESDDYLCGEQLFCLIDSPSRRLGLLACYELRSPEVIRAVRTGGAEILLMFST